MHTRRLVPLLLSPDGDPSGNEAPVDAVRAALDDLKARAAAGTLVMEEEPYSDTAGSEPPPADPAAAPAEGEAPPEGEPAAEGQPRDEQGKFVAAGDDADPDAARTVLLPGRRAEDAPVPLVVEDVETAERLRQGLNNGLRGQEYLARMAELDAKEAEFDGFLELARRDPIGLVLDHLGKDPAKLPLIAEHLLARADVRAAVLEKALGWEQNPDAAEAARLRLENERLTEQPRIQADMAAAATNKAIARSVNTTLDRLVSLVPEGRRAAFDKDLTRDIGEWASEVKIEKYGPQTAEVYVKALEPRLALYGLTLEQALAAVNDPAATPHPVPAARPKGPAAERLAAPAAQGKRPDGQQLARGAAVRRDVAKGAPGAGASSNQVPTVTPPAGQTIKERSDWMRQNVRLRPSR